MVIPSGPLAAMACIQGEGNIRGTVKFYPVECATLIVARIFGLPENESGFFGLHIHEGESCGGENYAETSGHYDPDSKLHPNHAGDLPPLMRYRDCAFLSVRTDRCCVQEVIGKTVVIHDGPDDFHSQPAGNAGEKIACGVICKK